MKADRPGIEPATCNRKSNACATTPLYPQCCLHLRAGQTCSVLGAAVPLQIQIIYFVWRLASINAGLKPESYTVAVSRYTKPAFHPSPGIGLHAQDSKSSVFVCLDRCSCVVFCFVCKLHSFTYLDNSYWFSLMPSESRRSTDLGPVFPPQINLPITITGD